MTATAARPTDLAILLAFGRARRGPNDGWLCAEDVRGQLHAFGFAPRAQQVAAWLGRLAGEDMPCVESRLRWGRDLEYRLTVYGRTLIKNRLPSIRFER